MIETLVSASAVESIRSLSERVASNVVQVLQSPRLLTDATEIDDDTFTLQKDGVVITYRMNEQQRANPRIEVLDVTALR